MLLLKDSQEGSILKPADAGLEFRASPNFHLRRSKQLSNATKMANINDESINLNTGPLTRIHKVRKSEGTVFSNLNKSNRAL